MIFHAGASPLLATDAIPLTAQSTVRLADVDEGASLLRSEDRFTAELSRFDRQCRLQTSAEVTLQDYLRFAGGEVLAWRKQDIRLLRPILHRIGMRFSEFALPLPPEILLIRTTGREEGNAAYCRQHAVVLPQSYLEDPAARLERILIHEFFHILSSHNAELRKQMYALIGFRFTQPIVWPEPLMHRRLTNPDGPATDVVIKIEDGDEMRMATPILFASAENFEPQAGKKIFDYLVFRLMLLDPDGEHWKPREVDGELQLRAADEVPSFHRQIGRNTGYVLHPDEIMAENFVHLMMETEDLATPKLVEQLRDLLTKS